MEATPQHLCIVEAVNTLSNSSKTVDIEPHIKEALNCQLEVCKDMLISIKAQSVDKDKLAEMIVITKTLDAESTPSLSLNP